MEQLNTILEWVVGFASGTTGSVIIALLIKYWIGKRAETKKAQAAKLTEADKKEIIEGVGEYVVGKINGKITLDIDAQLDKATNKRISAIEAQQEKIVEATNRSANYSRATMSAIGSFRSIPVQCQQEIAKLAQDEPLKIEEPVKPTVEFVAEKKVENKKPSVKY